MGTVQRRKRTPKAHKDFRKQHRTRRRTKDIDQIHEDLKSPLSELPIDEDLPGMGQFFCRQCALYMATQNTLDEHLKTKKHKKRVKLLLEDIYTQKEADAGANMSSSDKDTARYRRLIREQKISQNMEA